MSDILSEADEFQQMIVAKTKASYPNAVQQVNYFLGELTLEVDRTYVADICTFLRDDPDLRFNVMCDLTAVDMWPEHPRFEVNLHLLALPQHPQAGQGTRRVRVKVHLEEHDAQMPTLTGVWPAANWYERETAELFGITFDGHPDPRPLLLPEDWEGTPPLRRDVPMRVEEVAFSFNQDRVYSKKPFVKE